MGSEADEICEALGFTVEEAADAAEFVQDRKEFAHSVREVRTTRELPGGKRVHLHQLVTDSEGCTYVVTDLTDDTVKLVEFEPPMTNEDGPGTTDIAFLTGGRISYGELMMQYNLHTVYVDADEVHVEGEEVPEFAY